MKIERSKEWWLKQADKEGDGPVAAGVPATPTPTHASAVLGMVDYVRSKCPTLVIDGDVVCRLCVEAVAECKCPASKARTALAAWEQRPRLRDDEALVSALWDVVGHPDTLVAALDVVERHMFGAAPAVAGEPLICGGCRCRVGQAQRGCGCPCHRTGPHPGGEPG